MSNRIASLPNEGSDIANKVEEQFIVAPEYQKFFEDITDGFNRNSGQMVGSVFKQFGNTITGITSIIIVDQTVPQNTEGVEVMTLDYTPRFTDSILKIEVNCLASRETNSNKFSGWTVAVFRDAVAGALSAKPSIIESDTAFVHNHTGSISLKFSEPAGSIVKRTYKVRIGPGEAGSMIFNGDVFGAIFGTLPKSYIEIEEIAA